MTTYLAIITTILIVTQIIRVTQNHISLRRQNMLFDKEVGELKDIEVKKEDFENQRKFYKLAIEKMETGKIESNYQQAIFGIAISALEKQSDKNCSRCVDRNRCAIHKTFNIDYCSDWSVEE